MQGVEFFVGVAQPPRVVYDEHPVAHHFEEERHVEVLRVERGVGADEEHVDVGEVVRGPRSDDRVQGRRRALDLCRVQDREHRPPDGAELVRAEGVDLVAATLRFEHQGEGGVLVDEHAFDRIHQEGDAHSWAP